MVRDLLMHCFQYFMLIIHSPKEEEVEGDEKVPPAEEMEVDNAVPQNAEVRV